MRIPVSSRAALATRIIVGSVATCMLLAMSFDGRATSSASADITPSPHATLPALLHEILAAKPAPPPSLADSLAAEAALPDSLLHAPLEQYFSRFTADRRMARRVTKAVVHYARAHDVAPSLVAAVLVTENRTLKPRAASSVGAQGLMQVMPMHAGMKGCPSSDLGNVENNICHGTRILRTVLDRAQTTRGALLRYNGCVAGTNTPDCWKYPRHVLTRASTVRKRILAETDAFAPKPPPLSRIAFAVR
jgi:soluble lytic murein transglycosylase-like protein